MSKEKTYTYETKCRRCGHITEWYFAKATDVEYHHFREAMNDKIDHPRAVQCRGCGKHAVADVISFTGPTPAQQIQTPPSEIPNP